jgi:hypothetical protein
MDAASDDEKVGEIRAYCVSTIREAYTGGTRYAVNLSHYEASNRSFARETPAQLIALYRNLVQLHQVRSRTAIIWLRRHFPEDVDSNLERVVPHSDLWFNIVDRVEPKLGILARTAMAKSGSPDACSSCGDPGRDYRLINSAEAMPGVPSLRLCDDCLAIRQGIGELLEPMQSAAPRNQNDCARRWPGRAPPLGVGGAD